MTTKKNDPSVLAHVTGPEKNYLQGKNTTTGNTSSSGVLISEILGQMGVLQPDANQEALLPRLMRLGDPPHYERWWQRVITLMEDTNGFSTLCDAVKKCERNRDPLQRQIRDEGVIKKPALYVSSVCKKHLALFSKRLPAPPMRKAS